MSKKIKKNRNVVGGRNREKINRVYKKLDKISLLLILLCLISLGIIWNKPYDLETTGSNGYPALFLLTLAFLPLELFEAAARFIEMPQAAEFCGTFIALGCASILTVVCIWLAVRFLAAARYGINGVKIATALLKIFAIWGVFQLGCYLVSVSLEENDDDAVRKQMKHNIPAEKSGKGK